LQLTDRCGPFKNGGLNSLSAAAYHHLLGFIASVDVPNRTGEMKAPYLLMYSQGT
jgi:hypothetical protein